MPKGFVYILECSDGSYYTGSTKDIDVQIKLHKEGKGANYTKRRLPVKLILLEEFQKIDDAFYKEKQIQGWNRKKKEALIEREFDKLPKLSECKNESHSKNAASTPLSHDSVTNLVVEQSRNYQQESESQKKASTPLSRLKEEIRFYSNGKLLLTGEYLVLDGAKSLAIPTKFGQDLVVQSIIEPVLLWQSLDIENNCWFEAEFRLPDLRIVNESFDANSEDSKESIAQTLQKIVLTAKEMNPEFLIDNKGYRVETKLSFPRDWGLGTSSTLINNIAQWAKVDAFKLLNNSFGGSGYDIACAQNNTPITFQIINKKTVVNRVEFNPPFSDNLFFVHLNQKQDSKKGIKRYNEFKSDISKKLKEVSLITEKMLGCQKLLEFEKLIIQHEKLISSIIQNKPIKEIVFSDYFGQIKSLGAWGGDFVLATGNESSMAYFKSKGFETVIPYKDMVL